jgi:hypothetical protein
MTARHILLASLIVFALPFASPAFADPARFLDNANGSISDTKTGLMWQKADSLIEIKKGFSWYETLEYVDKKNAEKLAGFGDWRLPTMQELRDLWDPSLPGRSKDGEPIGLPKSFPSGGSYYLWSSDERGLNNAWYFGLGNKEDYFNLKEYADLEQGARLVRKQN